MISIGGYEIDIAEVVEHTYDSEVTEHPVERGADIADHIRERPITLTINGLVSNTPIGAIADRRGDIDARGVLVNRPSDDARAWLEAIRAAREPIQVVTPTKTYELMILERLSFSEDSQTGDAFRFRSSFKQIQIVTNDRTTVLVTVPQGKAKVNRGSKASPKVPDAPPSPEKAATNASTLTDLTGFRRVSLFEGL